MTILDKLSKRIAKTKHTQKRQPGLQSQMQPKPKTNDKTYLGSNKLKDKVAIITGGDSGIGRAVAVFFAREGADIVVPYLNEHKDAEKTKELVEQEGRSCLLISGDLANEKFCHRVIAKSIRHFKQINILVNNAAEQHPHKNFADISSKKLKETFQTNVFAYFFMTQAALPYLKKGSTIINTTSVTAYRGSDHLVDYSATKGAIVSFTRSLSLSLIKKGIRVNAVAPGPIWTPLIPATFSKAHIKKFGQDVPIGRPGQPEEIAPSYVFLASDDSSYMSGQVLHPNGGEIING
ncbi:MAG: SDR family oxidoreductase [Gammaproteobacteria bacterium]|nr:SDR family oxidoreductase [Gammaproteobacteria bacterium]